MPAVALAGAAASVRPTPTTPTISHTAAGQFTILNYIAANSYSLSQTSGSSSRAGAVVTYTGTTGTCTVTATGPKGGVASPGKSYERTPYTYYYYETWTTTNWYEHAGGSHGNGPTWSCTYYPSTNTSGHTEGYYTGAWAQNGTPGGYSDSGADWYRII